MSDAARSVGGGRPIKPEIDGVVECVWSHIL